MSKHNNTTHRELQNSKRISEQDNRALYLPIVSAADVGRSNYARVMFDQHISEAVEEHARQRAPNNIKNPDKAFRNHLIGIASEVATATWRRGQIDQRIFPDYKGDCGFDVTAPSNWRNADDRYQVKATRDMLNPERNISQKEVEKADVFVLCCTDAPKRYVEIVGYITKPALNNVKETYGTDGYLLRPEILYPVEPKLFKPNEVREAMYG